jgi:hypothetical protein
MANVKSTKVRAKPAAAAPKPRRASQRARGVELELGYPGKLRPLMIEHSRTEEGGYITVYAGVRGEFLSAGVPAHLIPTERSVEFQISRGRGADILRATMSLIGGDRLELEINWGESMPYNCGHPAICELARMMLIDLGYWYKDHSLATPDLEQPIRKLLADQRATDFTQPNNAPRLQISADFRTRLSEIGQRAFEQVHRYGEVFPIPTQAKEVLPERKGSAVRLVVDNTREVTRG